MSCLSRIHNAVTCVGPASNQDSSSGSYLLVHVKLKISNIDEYLIKSLLILITKGRHKDTVNFVFSVVLCYYYESAIAKILCSYICILIIKIRANDFGGGPVTFRSNWPSRPVEKVVLALPLDTVPAVLCFTMTRD